MNRIAIVLQVILAVSSAWSPLAFGRDDVVAFPIADVLNQPQHSSRLVGVKFFFGDQAHPAIARSMGEYLSNKKTNAFNKSDKEACEWAFMSALLSLHQRALSSGGDAVVEIKGFYKKIPFSSATEFQCGVGATIAGVTLSGTVVKLAEGGSPPAKPASSTAGRAGSTPAPAGNEQDVYDQLIKLDQLRKQGILTEQEFQAEKAKILSQQH